MGRALALLLIVLAPAAAHAARPRLEAVWHQARLAIEKGDLPLAEKRIDDALRHANDTDGEWYWALRMLRGHVLAQQLRMAEARQILEPELPPQMRESEPAARRLLTLAFIDWYTDRRVDETRIDQARRIAEKIGPRVLADVYLTRGNLLGNEADLKEAARQARKTGNDIVALKAEASLVWIYYSQRRYAEAVLAGETLLPRVDALGLGRTGASLAGNLANVYFDLGDYETAEQLLTRAERDAPVLDKVFWLNLLGRNAMARRDWSAAAKRYRRVVELTRNSTHREYGHALANLARVSVESGRFDEARTTVAQAIETEKKALDIADVLHMRIIEARIDASTGRTDTAAATLLRIIRESEEPQVRFEAQTRLAQLYAGGKRDDALAARYFGGAIDAARETRKQITNPELRVSFFNTVSDLFSDYIDFLVSRGRVVEALAVAETARAQTLEEGLGAAVDSPRLDPRAIAKQSDATILCYWLGHARSYLWVVTPAAVRVHVLPPDREIETAVQRYGTMLLGTRGTLKRSGEEGQALYRMLVGPAGTSIASGSRVVVIADGKLHALNFETLVLPPSPERAQHYWIEDAVLTSAGSLQLLSRSASRRSGTSEILLIGDPPPADLAFPPLARAGEEIASVASHFQRRTILDRARATPDAYRAAEPGRFDYIHFVAHGVATRKRPLDSAVILARGASGYRLFARDVMKQPLRARLVTISSCHGAGTRTYAGEGLVGLAWAFLRAGSEQVIAALWEVSDNATPELMDTMYAGIHAGREPAIALRDAKLKLVRSKSIYAMPKYWAPFVLYAGS